MAKSVTLEVKNGKTRQAVNSFLKPGDAVKP